jgi:radical SAM-linked protein
VPGGPPPEPIVQRLSIRYAKRGRMRFASHRDVARAIERGVRKAGVPVAYSAGFTPHPRISYSGGAPTGSTSEAEYLEISLTRSWEPADLGRLLDAALPDGIDVVEVVEVDAKSAGLRLDASRWEVLLPGVTADAAAAAVDAFLAAPTAPVERLTSKGKRQLDARAAVVSLQADRHVGTEPGAGCAILRMVVRQLTPVVRPDDVLAALSQFTVLALSSPPVATRLWQGPLDERLLDEVLADKVFADTAMTAQRGTYGVTGTAVTGIGPVANAEVANAEVANTELEAPQVSSRRLAVNQAMRHEAGSADSAPAVKARANEQLSRGERADSDDLRAREPNGRDCPNARNRATKPTARSR